jgi:hypothetical protein
MLRQWLFGARRLRNTQSFSGHRLAEKTSALKTKSFHMGEQFPCHLRTNESDHFFAPFITQREWINPESVIDVVRYKRPVDIDLFAMGKLADSANPGHGSLPPGPLSLANFLDNVKRKDRYLPVIHSLEQRRGRRPENSFRLIPFI